MKYIFTSLIILFVLNGCAKKLDHPKTELNYTITNEIMNHVTSASTGLGMSGTAIAMSALDAGLRARYDLKINAKTIKGRWSRIKSKGKLVITYKDLKKTVYTRDKDEVHIEYDWLMNTLDVFVSPEGDLSGTDIFYTKP